MSETYKNSGVNIEAGDQTVERIKSLAKSTFNKNVLSGIGLFGAFYEIDTEKYKKPVLVSSVDGVGTKLKLAFMTGKHDTIGQDLVNHCVNDIAVCGAEPLYFMDYMAFGKLVPDTAEAIISGFAKACRENGCALIGGETAEMPGFYAEDEYDISGTIVGVVEKDKVINGEKVQKGDILLGLRSTGLHTNGYSLARKVLFPKYSHDTRFDSLKGTLGEELLAVHKSYLPEIRIMKEYSGLRGLSHITGGGIIGNTKRILNGDLSLKIDWDAWELPEIFRIIQNAGNIAPDEMRMVFNIGIGLIAVAAKEEAQVIADAVKSATGESPVFMGEVA